MNKLGQAMESYFKKIGLTEQIKQRKWLQNGRKWSVYIFADILDLQF